MSEREKGEAPANPDSGVTRRRFLRQAGLGTLGAFAGAGILAACGDDGGSTTTAGGTAATSTTAAGATTAATTATGRTIKIGFVSPQTGPIAGFGEADDYILGGARAAFADGLSVAGVQHPIEIVAKDSQSDPVRAGEVAADLILDDEVDLMVVASTPETTNPVADQCEINGVPCISTVAPWQPWFFGRGGDPAVGFMWTYHYFWGLEGLIPQFISLWDKLETSKIVGGLFPNDGDGNAWGDPELGFPAPLAGAGYQLIDPGRYENLNDDFTAQINAFKDGGVEIVTGVPIPPDFTTFWTQAAQQGLDVKAATIGKAILFPANVEALDGNTGDGLSSEVWWSPHHPFSSSLTGASADELADGYTAETGRQWTQILGFNHSLFELAADVLGRTQDVDDPDSILAAIQGTSLDTIVGPVDFTGTGPVPNVSTTPLVGGQWRLGGDFQYDMVIVDNSQSPTIPTTGEMVAIA